MSTPMRHDAGGDASRGSMSLGQPLLLKPAEAARQLGVSERTLWANTQPRGPIPSVRIGNCVRYSSDQLRRYIDQQTSAAVESSVAPGSPFVQMEN